MTSTLGTPTVITVPTVVTDRLVLRCWTAADVDPYAAMNADPRTMRYLHGPFDRAATEELVRRLVGMWALCGHGMWAVADRHTGEFLGRAGTYYADGWPAVEVAVSIRRDRWGQGLATEACTATIDWAFATLPLTELITFTSRDNAAMNAVARKLGMTFLSDVTSIGPWTDINLYATTRDQWH